MSKKPAKKHTFSYQKPKLTKIRVTLNRFSRQRFIASEDVFLFNYLAQTPGCCQST